MDPPELYTSVKISKDFRKAFTDNSHPDENIWKYIWMDESNSLTFALAFAAHISAEQHLSTVFSIHRVGTAAAAYKNANSL